MDPQIQEAVTAEFCLVLPYQIYDINYPYNIQS